MPNLKKIKIVRYCTKKKKPPLEFVKIDEMQVEEPNKDEGGVYFYKILNKACRDKGYRFRFYSLSADDPNFDYEVVVY